MKRRQYNLLRHLQSLCLMTRGGVEVEITRLVTTGATCYMLRGRLKTECRTLPRNICWTPYGRYLSEANEHPFDLFVFREGEPFERLDLPREINRLKLETRENRRKVYISEVVPSRFPIRGYFEDKLDKGIKHRITWTQDGRWFNHSITSLDLMEVIEE